MRATPRMSKTVIPISLIAYDDDPNGLQKMHIENQLIMACHIKKNDLGRARDMVPEITQAGIYFLLKDSEILSIYVGKSGNMYERLKSHNGDGIKDYDSIVCIFGYREDTLDSTAIDWLEMTLIDDIKEEVDKGKKVNLINSVKGSSTTLQEKREITLIEYAEKVKWYLYRFGYNYSDVGYKDEEKENIEIQQNEEERDKIEEPEQLDDVTYLIKVNGNDISKIKTPLFYEDDKLTIKREVLKGKVDGYYDSETGYMFVMKGSKVKVHYKTVKSWKGYIEHSKVVLNNNLIEYNTGDEYGTLKENIAFTSPSTAASIVVGDVANGRDEWISIEGTTFGDLYKV